MNRLRLVLCLLTVVAFGQGLAQDVPPDEGAKPESVLFEALPVVEAASLHAQTLLEAPASVTVITDEEIRERGYRTLADVLSDVRGMYVTYDRAYHYVGVRGFSIPGDPNNRFLVMINGHSLTENVYGSANLFGQDFGLDLDLIKRIEIVRGPSSALYGTNGMFATINIVTKSPVEYQQMRASAELDSFRRAEGAGIRFGISRATARICWSRFRYSTIPASRRCIFPAFDTPQTNHGLAVDMDGEKGLSHFRESDLAGIGAFFAYFNNSEKIVPTAAYGTIFNDRGDKFFDRARFRGIQIPAGYRNRGQTQLADLLRSSSATSADTILLAPGRH